ncbi:hypothetical protein ACFQ22_02555 [Lentilactobacillus raoultii]|uniref:Uncharacterized protein n=1 Tax=Lentilactobacillus raoultii TaxID=1987503 RepID=A0ABW3PPJ0_9LACO|nr:hypothetical protein [Lentilactobacillus raoultii]
MRDFVIKLTPLFLAFFWIIYILTEFQSVDKPFLILVVATGYTLCIWLVLLFEKYK